MAGSTNTAPRDTERNRPTNIAKSVWDHQVHRLDKLQADLDDAGVNHDLALDESARIVGSVHFTTPPENTLADLNEVLARYGVRADVPVESESGLTRCHINGGSS